jgi:hypothetical protein
MTDLNGYDLDGTLCSATPPRGKSFFRQNGAERREYERVRLNHYLTAPVIMYPLGRFTVISGRSIKYYGETCQWLEAHGLFPESVHLYPGKRTRAGMISFKLETCRLLGVTTFYEDDRLIVKALKAEGVDVVLVEGGRWVE